MQHYIDVVQDRSGNAIGNAIVTVKNNSSDQTAPTYSDSAGLIPLTSIMTANNGTFSFYIASGRYNISITKNGVLLNAINDIFITVTADYPTAMSQDDAIAGINLTPQTISADVLQGAMPTAMSYADAVAGTSTTPQSIAPNVLVASNIVQKYADVNNIPANFTGIAKVGTDLYVGDGTNLNKDVSSVYLSASNTGAVNSALIQAALNIGGTVNIDGSGVCLIDTTLVINSNTALYVSDLVTLRAGLSTTGALLKNKSYTLTPTTCVINYTLNDQTAIVTLTNHGYVVGDYVYLSGATTNSGFKGCFNISSVTNANTFVVKLNRIDPAMVTGAVAGTTKCVKADTNFSVSGGKWDYRWQNSTFNQSGGNGPNDVAIWIVGAANFKINDLLGVDTKKYFLGLQGVNSFVVDGISGNLQSDGVKIYGPACNGKAVNLNVVCGDDVISFQTSEMAIYQYIMPFVSGGDCFNLNLENNSSKTNLANGLAIYSADSADGLIDAISASNINAIANTSSLMFDSPTAYTANFGTFTINNLYSDNITTAGVVMGSTGPVNIKNLTLNSPSYYNKSFSRAFIQTGFSGYSLASSTVVNVNGGHIQDSGNIVNLIGGALLADFNFNGTTFKNSYQAFLCDSSSNFNFNNVLTQGIIYTMFKPRVAGITCNYTMTNCDLKSTFSTNFVELSNGANANITLKNVNFSSVPTVFIANTTAHTSTVNLYCDNVTWNGTPTITNAGGTTIVNSWGDGLVIDVINLSLTKGQKAWHSSAVAGRNAANQQGPAFCNGTNWYALGTGAAGVNTLIR